MLTDQDLQQFRELLLRVRARILADYEHLTDEALESSSDSRSPQHLAELGTDAYEREFSLRFAETDQHVLEEIRQALTRIEEGTYGLCESCLAAGKKESRSGILKVRLKEIPYARNCIACERDRESAARR